MKAPDPRLAACPAPPGKMPASLRALIAALAGGSLAAIAGIVQQILARYPVNHVGYDIRQLYLLAGIAVVAGSLLLARRSQPAWLPLTSLLAGAALAGTILFADALNLLVEYQTWGGRHLPEPFQTTW